MAAELDLAGLVERAVSKASSIGVDKCDVVACDTRNTSAELERGSIKQASLVSDPGMGIRIFHKGSSGFAFCTSFDESSYARAIEVAASLARAGTEDADFRDLPLRAMPSAVSGLNDPTVAELSPEELVSMTIDMADRAGDDKRITSVNASASVSVCRVALANSNGFCASQELSSVDVMVESVAKANDTMFSGFDGAYRRRLEPGMLDRVADTARDQAIKGLAQVKLATGDYPVVIAPFSVAYVLGEAIGDGVNADSVQRGRSYLASKLGEKIGADSLTVIDDPTVEWGIRSTGFDGEGTPSKAKEVMVQGKLVSFLHDSYTAGKASAESTGNSSRGGGAWSFRHPPGISASNLVFSPGDSDLDEMIRETKMGVYLRATFDSPNMATGEFSGLMMESYIIKDGEIGPSIRQATMGIDIPTLLSRVDMLGRTREKYFGVVAPPMRISSARIAGSA